MKKLAIFALLMLSLLNITNAQGIESKENKDLVVSSINKNIAQTLEQTGTINLTPREIREAKKLDKARNEYFQKVNVLKDDLKSLTTIVEKEALGQTVFVMDINQRLKDCEESLDNFMLYCPDLDCRPLLRIFLEYAKKDVNYYEKICNKENKWKKILAKKGMNLYSSSIISKHWKEELVAVQPM
jgi:hypothetical protein